MSKLFKLREWLTVPEAAKHLSGICNEEVDKADILRLALDGRLKLSIRLVNPITARLWVPTPLEASDVNAAVSRCQTFIGDKNGSFQLAPAAWNLERGVWGLPMIGWEVQLIENRYQELTGGPHVDLDDDNPYGVLVNTTNGFLYQLQDKDGPKDYPSKALSLPKDGALVVETEALIDFANLINGAVNAPPTQKEKTTYLNIIGGLLDLMLGETPSGKKQSVFNNNTAIIDGLLARHNGRRGISKRTLEEKFAEAKRSLNAAVNTATAVNGGINESRIKRVRS
jgi:hypothetical protein